MVIARVTAVVFAGERRVWLVATAAGLPLMLLVLAWLVVPRPYFTGTDSVNSYTLTGPVLARQQVCARGLKRPRGHSAHRSGSCVRIIRASNGRDRCPHRGGYLSQLDWARSRRRG